MIRKDRSVISGVHTNHASSGEKPVENGSTKCMAIYGSALVLAGVLSWGVSQAVDQTGPSAHTALSPAELYRSVSRSLCMVIATRVDGGDAVLGSGFVISDDGDVATNAHVVMGRPLVSVKCDGVLADVMAVSRLSEKADVAQLITQLAGITPLPTASDGSRPPGTKVFVFGSPEGLEGTMSEGIVSARRVRNGVHYLQITAPISQGSSGGPVVNDRGEVVGIATAILASGQNLNFAVSVSELLSLPMRRQSLTMLGREASSPIKGASPRLPVAPSGAACTPEQYRAGVCARSVSNAPDPTVPNSFGAFRGHALGTSSACEGASWLESFSLAEYAGRLEARTKDEIRRWLRLPQVYVPLRYEPVSIGMTKPNAFYGCNRRQLVVGGYLWERLKKSELQQVKSQLRDKYGHSRTRPALDSDRAEVIWDMKDGGQIVLRSYDPNLNFVSDTEIEVGPAFVAYFYPKTLDALREELKQETRGSL